MPSVPASAIDDHVDAYDVATVCRRASIGRTKLYEEIAAGRLRALKLGRRTLILRRDYDRWLAGLPALHAGAGIRPVAGARRRRANGSPAAVMPKGPLEAGAAGGGGTATETAGTRHRSAAP
ncbi:MAG: helix-turn-helix domain-containing protein [Stellaceae bacterium]